METKFQTSFIPKKPVLAQASVEHSHRSVSLFGMFAVLLFIASLAGAGFSVVWQNKLMNDQTADQQTLQSNENQFNPTLISTLQRFSDKISVAENLINGHLAVSQIFTIIAALTAQNVGFTSLSYTAPSNGGPAMISMKGVAQSFSDIAFQSDIFGSAVQFGTNTKLLTPVLSNLSLGQSGGVGFTFTAGINPSDISYSKFIQ